MRGLEQPNIKERTILATELLIHPERLENSKKIVVIGVGVVGCEIAYWLRYEQECNVKVVEMDSYIMNHTCTANRGYLIHYLKKGGVELLNDTKVIELVPNGVKVLKNDSNTVPDPYVTWHPILPENIKNPLAPKRKQETKEYILGADLVVLATGGKPNDSMYFEALRERIAPEIYNIGDSFSGGKVLEATRAAYRLGITI